MTNLSYKTAIRRKQISSPAREVALQNLLVGRCLDYGCGHGFDADYLKIAKYDPYWHPTYPQSLFNTILCTYVLNTVPLEQEAAIIANVKSLLTPSGKAYFSVRRDIKGIIQTKKGTLQRSVTLNFPTLKSNSQYEIYIVEK